MLQRERDALLEEVRELQESEARLRDEAAAAEDRAEDADARARRVARAFGEAVVARGPPTTGPSPRRWADEQRTKNLESLAQCMVRGAASTAHYPSRPPRRRCAARPRRRRRAC